MRAPRAKSGRRPLLTLGCLLVLVALFGCNSAPAPVTTVSPALKELPRPSTRSQVARATPPGTWLADGVVTFGETGGDTPLVAGNYVFWKSWDASKGIWTLQAYDLSAGSGFTLTDKLDVSSFVASDGKSVVWRGSEPRLSSVQLFDLAAHTHATPREASGQAELTAYELAIDGDLLYYTNADGLHLRDLRTNSERLISATGKRPIAAKGMLLWVEEVPGGVEPTAKPRGQTPEAEEEHVGRPPVSPSRYWALHLLRAGQTGRGEVLTTDIPATSSLAYNIPNSYNMGGDYVVWTAEYRGQVTAYNVKSRKSKTISTNTQPYLGTLRQVVSGNTLVWIEQPTPDPRRYAIEAYDLATGVQRTIAGFQAGSVQAWGIAEDGALIYTVDGSLYSMPLRH
ncbi:MAG TPA: hypothetical protein VF914_01040 [Chloroflexia bacterium]